MLIVGNPEEFHVGAHFRRDAESLGWAVTFCDIRAAYRAPRLVRAFWWRCGRRPPRLRSFSREVLCRCRAEQPTHVLTTGLAPVVGSDLDGIDSAKVIRMNFLTDDPWNPVHHAPWFFEALKSYDAVFSPRRANLDDLVAHGCQAVHYLPFAYSPKVHLPERPIACDLAPPAPSLEGADVLFAGGADADRLPYVRALVAAGLKPQLYGGYWDGYPELRTFSCGHADLQQLRRATSATKIVLCLVRRANRDGHAMRTFEVPAMGGCILVEDTEEHREILGPDGNTVIYFRSIPEMVERAKWLLVHEAERRRLAAAAHRRITAGRNTYADRLQSMLELAESQSHRPRTAVRGSCNRPVA